MILFLKFNLLIKYKFRSKVGQLKSELCKFLLLKCFCFHCRWTSTTPILIYVSSPPCLFGCFLWCVIWTNKQKIISQKGWFVLWCLFFAGEMHVYRESQIECSDFWVAIACSQHICIHLWCYCEGFVSIRKINVIGLSLIVSSVFTVHQTW
jgi:hypothetical protein